MPLGKPNLQWPAKIVKSLALFLVGAVVGTGLYFANLSYIRATSVFAKGRITVALKKDQPGMSEVAVGGSVWSGFDYDLATYIAHYLKVQMTPVVAPAEDRVSLLQSDRIDLVVSTFSQTAERARQVSMAGPYLLTGQGVAVRDGDTSIRNTSDLKGKTVCAVTSSTSLAVIGVPGSGILPVEEPDFGTCVQDLLEGRVDAISTDQVILYGYAQQHHAVRVVPSIVIGALNRYVVGLPPGHHDDCVKVATAIHAFLNGPEWTRHFTDELPGVVEADPSWKNRFAPSPDEVKCQT